MNTPPVPVPVPGTGCLLGFQAIAVVGLVTCGLGVMYAPYAWPIFLMSAMAAGIVLAVTEAAYWIIRGQQPRQ